MSSTSTSSLLCARIGFQNPKSKTCSVCLATSYCSAKCQKKDWKLYKIMCPLITNINKNILLPIPLIRKIIEKLNMEVEARKGKDSEAKFLEFVILFATHQFGSRLDGKAYR